MDLRELFSFLAIHRLFFYYPKIAHELICEVGSAAAVFENDRGRFLSHFGNNDALWKEFCRFDDWKLIERTHAKILKLGIAVLCLGGEEYPKLLSEIHDPPPVLFVRGEGQDLMNVPAVAIVGSRKASENGRRVAAEIAEHLSENGVAVVSGLAYGIDAAAHRGAIRGGRGTVAVLGSGLDIIYPSSHADIAKDVESSGAIISEFPLGTLPQPQHFPQRNRIISGMCVAVVIVEAAERSGSLITARFALEHGREVMAAPGPAATLNAGGTNRLIRDGAALVERGEDVMEIIANLLPRTPFPKKTGLFGVDMDKHSPLLSAMRGRKAMTVDEIIAACGMSAQETLEVLTKLTVAGMAAELPGRKFRLKGDL